MPPEGLFEQFAAETHLETRLRAVEIAERLLQQGDGLLNPASIEKRAREDGGDLPPCDRIVAGSMEPDQRLDAVHVRGHQLSQAKFALDAELLPLGRGLGHRPTQKLDSGFRRSDARRLAGRDPQGLHHRRVSRRGSGASGGRRSSPRSRRRRQGALRPRHAAGRVPAPACPCRRRCGPAGERR